jgi:hypothetical protein
MSRGRMSGEHGQPPTRPPRSTTWRKPSTARGTCLSGWVLDELVDQLAGLAARRYSSDTSMLVRPPRIALPPTP